MDGEKKFLDTLKRFEIAGEMRKKESQESFSFQPGKIAKIREKLSLKKN